MKRALIIDTETTGLDPSKHAVIEVAAIVYDLDHATYTDCFSTLLPADSNEAEAINGIPEAVLREAGSLSLAPADTWGSIRQIASMADVILAHNAEFDRAFVQIGTGGPLRRGSGEGSISGPEIPWVCTKDDIAWPKQFNQGMSLVPLALAHGLGVGSAHRAMDDAMLIARLLMRVAEMGVDLQELIARGMRPKIRVVSMAPFSDRETVKSYGFRWSPERKVWWRNMPEDDIGSLPFQCRVESR